MQREATFPANIIYLALGANLGPRHEALRNAVRLLTDRQSIADVALSPIYETDAVADHPQPPYLNAVLRAKTSLSPESLLAACLATETTLGRTRPVGVVKAPRTIDVDVLLMGNLVMASPDLVIPHPELLRRSFVRIPLADVAIPGLVHPVTGERLDVAGPDPAVRVWHSA